MLTSILRPLNELHPPSSVLPPKQIRPLLELFLEPLGPSFCLPGSGSGSASRSDGSDPAEWAASEAASTQAQAELLASRVLPPPWWASHLGTRPPSWWLAAVDGAALDAQPGRRKVGFLNACEWVGGVQESQLPQ